MGNAESHEDPLDPFDGIDTLGYRVLGVQPDSPAAAAGLVSFLDFLVGCSGKMLLGSGAELEPGMEYDDVDLPVLLEENKGKELEFLVWNIKSQESRLVKLTPSDTWGGAGLLGVTIRLDNYAGAEDRLVRVLTISETSGSPAAIAGVLAETDYLLGTTHATLDSVDRLASVLADHVDKVVELYVYNTETDMVRVVALMPTENWDGPGLLGAEVGTGYLHRLPSAVRTTEGRSVQRKVRYSDETKKSLEMEPQLEMEPSDDDDVESVALETPEKVAHRKKAPFVPSELATSEPRVSNVTPMNTQKAPMDPQQPFPSRVSAASPMDTRKAPPYQQQPSPSLNATAPPIDTRKPPPDQQTLSPAVVPVVAPISTLQTTEVKQQPVCTSESESSSAAPPLSVPNSVSENITTITSSLAPTKEVIPKVSAEPKEAKSFFSRPPPPSAVVAPSDAGRNDTHVPPKPAAFSAPPLQHPSHSQPPPSQQAYGRRPYATTKTFIPPPPAYNSLALPPPPSPYAGSDRNPSSQSSYPLPPPPQPSMYSNGSSAPMSSFPPPPPQYSAP